MKGETDLCIYIIAVSNVLNRDCKYKHVIIRVNNKNFDDFKATKISIVFFTQQFALLVCVDKFKSRVNY